MRTNRANKHATLAECAARQGPHSEHTKLESIERSLTLILILCASLSGRVYGQTARIPISPKPVGSGARALGQSAFIAVADDATAASWNPAGLINLERPEVSFVGAWRSVEEDYSPTNPQIFSNSTSWSASEINFMSCTHPLVFGNTDVVLSVNYHQVYDFGVDFNTHETSIIPPFFIGQPSTTKIDIDTAKSEGAVSAYTLAGGLSIPGYPEITIGAGVNWYAQSLLNDYSWRVKSTETNITQQGTTTLPPVTDTFTEIYDDFRAHNFTVGVLWDAYERQENLLTLGLVYHTPFTSTLNWREFRGSVLSIDQKVEMDFPGSFGAGVNYRFSDSLSAAFDVEWKEWSKFKNKFADGTVIEPAGHNTLGYRLGGERLFLDSVRQSVFACRGGVFYEPRPAATNPDTVPIYGFSAGLGWTMMDRFSLDFAYQYRWGEEDLGNIDYKIKEDFFVLSLIRYF